MQCQQELIDKMSADVFKLGNIVMSITHLVVVREPGSLANGCGCFSDRDVGPCI